jgi:hypothetical protein
MIFVKLVKGTILFSSTVDAYTIINPDESRYERDLNALLIKNEPWTSEDMAPFQ